MLYIIACHGNIVLMVLLCIILPINVAGAAQGSFLYIITGGVPELCARSTQKYTEKNKVVYFGVVLLVLQSTRSTRKYWKFFEILKILHTRYVEPLINFIKAE